ncbi:MAG TPA: hypothetical protein VIG31_11240, partial [Rhodanobacteraceae bacterium]
MASTPCDATWERDDDEILLTGSWTLLLDATRRRRLLRELGQLGPPQHYNWNLERIDGMDSAGARVLWKVWGQRLPDRLECHEDHRHWFRWLEQTRFPPRPDRRWLDAAFERTGGRALGFARAVGGVLLLIGQLMLDVASCVRHPRLIPWKETTATIYRVGATSMLLLGVVGFLIGVVMAIQIGMALRQFGA